MQKTVCENYKKPKKGNPLMGSLFSSSTAATYGYVIVTVLATPSHFTVKPKASLMKRTGTWYGCSLFLL